MRQRRKRKSLFLTKCFCFFKRFGKKNRKDSISGTTYSNSDTDSGFSHSDSGSFSGMSDRFSKRSHSIDVRDIKELDSFIESFSKEPCSMNDQLTKSWDSIFGSFSMESDGIVYKAIERLDCIGDLVSKTGTFEKETKERDDVCITVRKLSNTFGNSVRKTLESISDEEYGKLADTLNFESKAESESVPSNYISDISSNTVSDTSSLRCSIDATTCTDSEHNTSLFSQAPGSKRWRSERRNAVQLKGLGPSFTIKDGNWTLWVDTLPKEEIEECKKAFSIFDKKGRGKITPKQLGPLMRTLGRNPDEGELGDMLNEMNLQENNGMVTFPIFLTVLAQKRCPTFQYVRETLEHLELDRKDMIDSMNLRYDLANVGTVLSMDEINAAFSDLYVDRERLLHVEDLVEVISGCGEDIFMPITGPEKSEQEKQIHRALRSLVFPT